MEETDLVTDCSRYLEEWSNQSKLDDRISDKSEIRQLTSNAEETKIETKLT
jgi:predicted transcriptional regulator